jgi:hypothetical protein
MAMQYQKKNVVTIRDAVEGDEGFKAGADQVVVAFEDGTTKTVKRSEVQPEPVPETTTAVNEIKPIDEPAEPEKTEKPSYRSRSER